MLGFATCLSPLFGLLISIFTVCYELLGWPNYKKKKNEKKIKKKKQSILKAPRSERLSEWID